MLVTPGSERANNITCYTQHTPICKIENNIAQSVEASYPQS